MKALISKLVACSLLSLVATTASASTGVQLAFVEPDKFADAQSTWLPAQSLFDGLSSHLQRLAEKNLPRGQTLYIEITDIDLAGTIAYSRHFMAPLRVLRELTYPRMVLRYRLQSGDAAAPLTAVTLRDMAYLTRINPYPASDPLRFEKRMLDDWFHEVFAPPR